MPTLDSEGLGPPPQRCDRCYEADYKSDFVPCPFHGIKRHMPFIMGTPDEPFLIIYCLALTKHIYKKIKSKYLNTPIKKYLKEHI